MTLVEQKMDDPRQPQSRFETGGLLQNSKTDENTLTDPVKKLVKNVFPVTKSDVDELEKESRQLPVVGLDPVENLTSGNHRLNQVRPDNCAA